MSVRHGYDFNYPLTAMQVEAHSGEMAAEHSFVAVTPDDVVLTAMKKAEDSNALIFHMYEWAGKSGSVEITVPKGATGAVETNLLEQAAGQALTLEADRITVPIRAYEILALRVDYPEKTK
jgi:alpha-mannosidase